MGAIAVLGVLARVEAHARDNVERDLKSLAGVSTFEVGDPRQLGILVETETMSEAEEIFRSGVEPLAGVLAAWPVFAQAESDESSTVEQVDLTTE